LICGRLAETVAGPCDDDSDFGVLKAPVDRFWSCSKIFCWSSGRRGGEGEGPKEACKREVVQSWRRERSWEACDRIAERMSRYVGDL